MKLAKFGVGLRLTGCYGKAKWIGKANPLSSKILATITAKGQITIPAAHRKAWGLRPGDQIVFDPPNAQPVTIEPKRKRSVFELLDRMEPLTLGRPLEQSDIEQAIAEEMTAQEARSKEG